jgi:ABC-type multidrug transport system permease subunit
MAAAAQTILCLIIHPFFEDDKMENIGNGSFWLSSFSRLTYAIQLTVGVTAVNKNVDTRALLVFQPLQLFYNTFD